MPTIPGVPTLSPVPQPEISPGESGRAGASLAQFGNTMLGNVMEQFSIETHMRKAQEHVDTLAARNELDAAYTQLQDQLAKTQNSRDVPETLQASHDELNEIANRWSNSPAAMMIQMDADALRPGMGHMAQMRQIDLMGKEFKISLSRQAEVYSKDYAAARAAGDSKTEQQALDGFTQAVQGGVRTGLMGDVEANDTVRLFRQSGQELQIKNAISNPDPSVNKSIYDQINAHPESFPDVTPEFLDTAKGHALAAEEAHIKHQQWADSQLALQTMLRPLVNQYTNSATGAFDEAKAIADITKQFRDGKISNTQFDALSKGITTYDNEMKQAQADRDQKAYDELGPKVGVPGGITTSQQIQSLPGVSEKLKHTLDTELRQDRNQKHQFWVWDRELSKADAQEKKQQILEQSDELKQRVRLDIAAGKVFEGADIRTMDGLTTRDKNDLIHELYTDNNGQLHFADPFVNEAMKEIGQLQNLLPHEQYELGRIFFDQVKSGDLRGTQIIDLKDKLVQKAKEKQGANWVEETFWKVHGGNSMIDRFRKNMASPPDGFDVRVKGKDGNWYWGNSKTREVGPRVQ